MLYYGSNLSALPFPGGYSLQRGDMLSGRSSLPGAFRNIGNGVGISTGYANEMFFEDPQNSGLHSSEDLHKRGKRSSEEGPRRRRTVYTSHRNLHCFMCGVTETPEWRRGPNGDHTLCNACGLHYAKSLRKQRREREGRKHSIEMLLNQSNQSNPMAVQQPPIENSTT